MGITVLVYPYQHPRCYNQLRATNRSTKKSKIFGVLFFKLHIILLNACKHAKKIRIFKKVLSNHVTSNHSHIDSQTESLNHMGMASIMEPWQDKKLTHKLLVWHCTMATLHMSYVHA